MKTESTNNKKSVPVVEKLLGFLAGAYEWNQRIALTMIDPLKYESYLYYQRIREENEARRYERRRVRQALSILDRAGLVVEKGGKYHLTPSGWIRFSLVYSRTIKKLKKKQQKHSKRNLIVIFDIPEKQRNIRDSLRQLLYSLGFSMLQQSVFISDNPDSFEVVSKVISNADVGNRVKLMVVDRIM